MARKKAGDDQAKARTTDGGGRVENTPNVEADHNSIAVGRIHIGGDVTGTITIGHGYTAEQVSVLLNQITRTLRPKPFEGRCPYKGLNVFEEEDAELFYGRERLVDDLVSRVKDSRTVFITGPSGSGKSSLVRAGLIHALKKGAIKNLHSEHWLYEIMKPGREPRKDLAFVFSRLKSPDLADYFKAHADEPDILHKCAESVLSGRRDQRLVLFVDQFEEVFSPVNQGAERQAFLNLLAYAGTIENGRVIVLFAIRSDFVSDCAAYPMLNELLSQQFRQIGAMQPEELVSAIALPAKQVGLPVEDALIARIINDMKGEPGALPLMQFALKDLFDSQQAQGGIIALRLEDYLRHGGIHKALERHADTSFANLGEDERQLARSIFSGLIEIGHATQYTRRTALFEELIPANAKAEDVQVVVRKLADARLIITDEQAGRDTVTISHETLITAWPWLERLVEENRDTIALQNEIANDAKEWAEDHQDKSYLYRGARLEKVREQLEAQKLMLSGTAYRFVRSGIRAFNDEIDAANREEIKRRLLQRRIVMGLFGVSAVILVLLVFALIQLNLSRATQLGAQALNAFVEENYNAAGLYAQQSNKIRRNDIADGVMDRLPYETFERDKALLGPTYEIRSLAWSADGRVASVSADGSVILWDLTNRKPAQMIRGYTISVSSVAWSADGLLASDGGSGSVMIWDLTTDRPAQTLSGHKNSVTSVAWSGDGRLASGSVDGSIILWNLASGLPAQTLKGPTNSVTSVAWSGDGRLASGSQDGSVVLWNLATNQPAQTLSRHKDTVTSVAWSTDGRLASASGDGSVIVWDLATGLPAQILNGHANSVASVAWSADGRLASGAEDGSVILWDLASGLPARTLQGHTDSVTSVAWSADGRLASGSVDSTIMIWDLSEEIARAPVDRNDPCSWIYRNMTADEWLSFQGAIYIYQPACPNLPVPIFDPAGDFRYAPMTWKGRLIMLEIVTGPFLLVACNLWAVYLLVSWLWNAIKERF